jgi:ubiquinone/menaquinone biosynthesis C-methylase UbiE
MTLPEERRDRILDGARLGPGDDVLDLSGWSALTFGAHERIGDGWVYTVAADVGLLEELLGAAHKLDAPGIAYLVGDVEALPLPDASVDAVVGASVLAEGVALDRAAGELRRVLRPAGRLSLCEGVVGDGEPVATALRAAGFADVSVELVAGDDEAWATARTP